MAVNHTLQALELHFFPFTFDSFLKTNPIFNTCNSKDTTIFTHLGPMLHTCAQVFYPSENSALFKEVTREMHSKSGFKPHFDKLWRYFGNCGSRLQACVYFGPQVRKVSRFSKKLLELLWTLLNLTKCVFSWNCSVEFFFLFRYHRTGVQLILNRKGNKFFLFYYYFFVWRIVKFIVFRS